MQSLYNDPYADGLHEAVMNLCRDFSRIRENVLEFESVRSLIEAYYQVLVNKKELSPLEDQNQDYKQSLWDKTKPIEKTAERIKASKALYVIDEILK